MRIFFFWVLYGFYTGAGYLWSLLLQTEGTFVIMMGVKKRETASTDPGRYVLQGKTKGVLS